RRHAPPPRAHRAPGVGRAGRRRPCPRARDPPRRPSGALARRRPGGRLAPRRRVHGRMRYLTTPDGVRLRYTDRGEGEHTIVLVHGWKGSHRMWDPAVYRLTREFRVIAFDNRGMGESDKP